MPAPYHDLRVLDLSEGIAGAYCTKLLADAGASVLKVEAPQGDPLRDHGWGERRGLLFAFLHAGQRAAQLTDAEIRAAYAGVDLVVASSTTAELDARGLGWEALHARNPAATLVLCTPFGSTGPWAGRAATEFTLLAAGGSTSTRGRPGRPYLNGGGRIGEWVGGVSAACAAAAALRRARATGAGDLVDCSLLEAVTPTCSNVQTLWGSLSGTFDTTPNLEIPSIEPTADGFVGFCVFTGQQWQDFCVLIDAPDLADDPELATMGGRIARGDTVRARIHAYTRARTTAEVVEEASLLRIPVAHIGNGADLPGFDHFVERGVYVEHPGGGFLQPRVPWRIHDDPVAAFGPAPALGEHTAAVRAELRSTAAASPAVTTPSPTADWPLAGVRVVDLTAFWAGPYATFSLACLGADVIHVESVQRPDGMRFGSVRPPGTESWWEWGPTFHSANAGKRSVTLDLTREAGRALLRRLVEQSDVLVENFAPRVLEQWGCTSDTLRDWNPRLVVVRMPAFGLDGPWRDRVGFAQTMEQTSGMAWLTGYPDTDPMNARGPCDPLAGMHATFAAIAGLARREHTGTGCFIEATMVETALNAAAEQVIEWTGNGVLLTRDTNHEPAYGLQGVFACADRPDGTMGAIAVAAATEAQRAALGALVGEALTGGRSSSDLARFDDVLAAWCAPRALHDTVELLAAHGVPAAAVAGSRTSDRNPQVGARGFFEEVAHPVIGTHRIPAFPVVFGRQPARRFARPAPLLGEHNAEVLGGLLGCTPTELAELEAAHVIGTRPLRA